jgi:hypothetical protein
MEVIAAGARVMVAMAATVAVIVGAIGGAIVWRGGIRLTLGGLSGMLVYFLAATALLGFSFLTLAVIVGIPILVLSFLISYLTARHLRSRTSLRLMWATPAAVGSALTVGFLYLLLFRLSLWAPVWIALGADACLILLAIRNWKLVPQ